MLKITKGLKKKKKGKKSKHKEDELFDSAELEEYRRQQQEKQKEGGEGEKEGEPNEASEEWLKFKALTSGVDDILKKTQGDLDRIKSTSYFQKKPPGPSQPPKEVRPARPSAPPPVKSKWVGFEEGAQSSENEQPQAEQPQERVQAEQLEEQVEEEEDESEFEDDQDDIFDTSFVDVVASGEVKLAFIPDSPIEEDQGPDPFDTSIVDKIIKVDPKEQKRSLVNLGCAVEVLSGKFDKSPTRELASTPRKRPKPQDLLLGSFDEGDGSLTVQDSAAVDAAPKSILDDDPVFEEETSAVLGLPPVTPLIETKPICTHSKPDKQKDLSLKELVNEFGEPESQISNEPEDELDDEFAELAAQSVSKKGVRPPRPGPPPATVAKSQDGDDDAVVVGDDPFDTSFTANVLPGKYELKIIEKEVLGKHIPIRINSVEEQINVVLKNSELSFRASQSDEPDVFDTQLEPLSKKHKDLLGGSSADLTQINQTPIAPKSVSDAPEFDKADPFDTTIAEVFVVPGKTELKFLEKELLDQPTTEISVDDDFDPRAEETPVKPPNRPDNLSVGKRQSIPKFVAFEVQFPQEESDLLAVEQDENSRIGKPLTPYYPPKTNDETESFEEEVDPFDTSFVSNCPGKLELKILEKELVEEEKTNLPHSLSDPDFNPRGKQGNLPVKVALPKDQPDIISGDIIADRKLHTPVAPKKFVEERRPCEDLDPFDTSIVNALVPGKAEIKILENELIHKKEEPSAPSPGTSILERLRRDSESFSSLRKRSITDVLELLPDDTLVKPLTPLAANSSFEQEDQFDDPFDTSGVGDILPGKTEIKILESELMLN